LVSQQAGDGAVQSSQVLLNEAAGVTMVPAAAADPPWYRTFPPFTAVRSSRASDANCRSLPAMAILPPLAPVASTSKAKKHDDGAYQCQSNSTWSKKRYPCFNFAIT